MPIATQLRQTAVVVAVAMLLVALFAAFEGLERNATLLGAAGLGLIAAARTVGGPRRRGRPLRR